MNKNLALFLAVVIGIAVFAVVVMTHVPRKMVSDSGMSEVYVLAVGVGKPIKG